MKQLMAMKTAVIRMFMNVGANLQRPATPRILPTTAGVVDRQPLTRLLVKFRQDIDCMAWRLETACLEAPLLLALAYKLSRSSAFRSQ
jgi:hypothetical protein